MIAKDSPCPECEWSGGTREDTVLGEAIMQDFALRMSVHARNYMIFMVLMLAAGLVSLLTAVMWFFVIYRGHIGAFVMVGVLTLVTGGLNVLLWYSRKVFPVDVYCPACNLHLVDLDMVDRYCPSCAVHLR